LIDGTKEMATMFMFTGFLSDKPTSRPATMIMFTGFLSDGTKELAGNYDHVSRVPE
jgi:hypothetical protein